MFYYRLNIEYDGTNYAGFQYQKDAPTIQGEINRALINLYGGKITTLGSSRTDTGVHAKNQLVKITMDSSLDESKFLQEFNQTVSKDIKTLEIFKTTFDFNPIHSAQKKEYRYFFTNIRDPKNLDRRFVANISNELDFDSMNIALKKIIGEHDFKNFTSMGSNVESTIRTIFEAKLSTVKLNEVFEKDSLFYSEEICFELKFTGNGFLKQMIRHLVASLWSVGTSKLSLEEFEKTINGEPIPKRLWKVAPPNGLFLFNISLPK